MVMEKEQQYHSDLFTIRLWLEDQGGNQSEWRGKVQHTISGEACYFHEWSTLIAFLLKWLPDTETGADSN